jgi:hypothetical protein
LGLSVGVWSLTLVFIVNCSLLIVNCAASRRRAGLLFW